MAKPSTKPKPTTTRTQTPPPASTKPAPPTDPLDTPLMFEQFKQIATGFNAFSRPVRYRVRIERVKCYVGDNARETGGLRNVRFTQFIVAGRFASADGEVSGDATGYVTCSTAATAALEPSYGWAQNPGGPDTLVVWLNISPEQLLDARGELLGDRGAELHFIVEPVEGVLKPAAYVSADELPLPAAKAKALPKRR